MQSERAGERVMQSIREFLETKLRLKINQKKSTVAPGRGSEVSWLSY
ncbi:MAG: hypothetical protein ABH827_03985 [bacterium]